MLFRRLIPSILLIASVIAHPASLHAAGRAIGNIRWDLPSGGILSPDLATNGSTFLTAWQPSHSRIVYATLYDRDGKPLREAIPIGAALPLVTKIYAVPLGDGYAVLWLDGLLRLVIIDAEGTPGPMMSIEGTARFNYPPQILSNGRQVFAIDTEYPAARTSITTLGTEGVTTWRRVTLPENGNQVLAATLVGDDVALVTAKESSKFLVRIVPSGTTTTTFLPPKIDRATAVAAGNDVVVVWSEYAASSALQSLVVRAAGAATPAQTLPSGGLSMLGEPRAAAVDGTILLTFRGTRTQNYPTDVLGLRLAPDGSSLDAAPKLLVSDEFSRQVSGLAVRGSEAVAVIPSINGTVWLFLHPNQGWEVEERLAATRIPAREHRPSISSDGLNFLAVWNAVGGTQTSVEAVLLDPASRPIAPAFSLASRDELVSQEAIAFGAGQYLVVSSSGNAVVLRRITPGGALLDPVPDRIERPSQVREVVVASDGQRFLVVWIEQSVVMGSVVMSDGTWSTPLPMTSEPPNTTEVWPRIAFNGQIYLLSYGAWYPNPSPFPIVSSFVASQAVRIARDGRPIDVKSVTLFPAQVDSPTVLAGGAGQFFVATVFPSTSLIGVVIHADETSINISAQRTYFDWFGFMKPAVAWNGHRFTLLLRYSQFMGRMQVALDGTPGPLLATANGRYEEVAGIFDFLIDPPAPASATNPAGNEIDLNAEIRPPAKTYRIVAYQPSELVEVHRPNAPEVISVIGDPTFATVTWSDRSSDEEGFLVEARDRYGIELAVVAPKDSTSLGIKRNSFEILSVRVRAFNAAGVSEPSRELAPVAVRRRSLH